MYNYNKSITRADNLNEFEINKGSFIIPQHIYVLLNKLKKFDLKANVNQILKLSASYGNQDSDLKNILEYFRWDEEKRIFESEIKKEELVQKIESAYDLKVDLLLQNDIKDGENESRNPIVKENSRIRCLSSMEANPNDHNRIYNNINNELNFSQNRNGKIYYFDFRLDGVESIFQVQKPIAVTNSQGFERNLMHYEFNDVFLTNSAKVGWNQHSQLVKLT